MHTIQSLQRDLRDMGLHGGDTVLMHSSMRRVGEVEGRADGVLDTLTAYFRDGLLALPTLTWELEFADPPVYDVLRTPSLVGVLTELFRKRPGVVRSWHPTHSMAALGRDAAWLVGEDHLCHTPCGLRSSWYKLIERDASILMVGCGLTSCTFFHGVEEWRDVPGRLKPPMDFTVVTPGGTRLTVRTSPHLGSPSEQFGRAEKALYEGKALREGRFGDASVLILSARRAYEVVSALLREDPGLFDEP